MSDLTIGILLYQHVDTIDVAAPSDVLSRIPEYSTTGVQLVYVAKTSKPIVTGQGITITPSHSFDDVAKLKMQFDVILVPGAVDVSAVVADDDTRKFIRAQAAKAKWVTSVCTGSIILAAYGLLDGYRATTHHLALSELAKYPKVVIANGYPRWVICGNRFTTGGVSASLDGALKLAEILTGDPQVSKCIQLEIQYHPQPPYDDGDPAVADFTTYDKVVDRTVKHC